jgi:DNA-3-methyladenine glycosylase II
MTKKSILEKIQYLKRKDKVLASIIKENLKDLPKTNKTIYEDLLSHIIGQQLSVKAALSIEKKFLNFFENKFPLPDKILQTSLEELKSLGLSRQKILYMGEVANFFNKQNITEKDLKKLSDEEIIKLLTQIKGIGKWTVEMILIFNLQREDVFSAGDLGLVRAIEKLYKIEKVKNFTSRKHSEKILEIAENWKPYRSLAVRYLWKFKDGDFDWEKERL